MELEKLNYLKFPVNTPKKSVSLIPNPRKTADNIRKMLRNQENGK